ncbi:hypothetical protein [Streptomyces sp. NBC_01443]|uniref:hypothetical protein n=1 Tax=Streptomyces sp. NBC_01443 TaxID=2903868 RepID=UPI00224D68DE|nr:hypothetical protein [Streptomyces sp. NBC_01443]MCX4632469.1 hypothetical protein [Streptomyces sp. NBC_01443]
MLGRVAAAAGGAAATWAIAGTAAAAAAAAVPARNPRRLTRGLLLSLMGCLLLVPQLVRERQVKLP